MGSWDGDYGIRSMPNTSNLRYAKVSDTSMPFENHDVQSSGRTTIAMFRRLGLPVKPTDACNPPVAPIGGFALDYPTRNLGKMQIRL